MINVIIKDSLPFEHLDETKLFLNLNAPYTCHSYDNISKDAITNTCHVLKIMKYTTRDED